VTIHLDKRLWLIVGVVALYLLNPVCPIHQLTGLNCPGCGATRALHQLVHGHVGAAVGFNPLVIIGLPFLGWILTRPGWLWAAVTVVVMFGVVRNIPAYPFTLLAP